MATIKARGIKDYQHFLETLEWRTKDKILSRAVYEAAGILADEFQTQIRALPTTNAWGTPANPKRGIRPYERAGLSECFGISRIVEDGGFVNVKLGFDGYFDGPDGERIPAAEIAWSVARGTTFMLPTNFSKIAVQKARKKCLARIDEIVREEIQNLDNS